MATTPTATAINATPANPHNVEVVTVILNSADSFAPSMGFALKVAM
jgi:hypothetical protein